MRLINIYHPKLYSEFMYLIQDHVSTRIVPCKYGVHSQNIKDLIYKFEYPQKDRVYKN